MSNLSALSPDEESTPWKVWLLALVLALLWHLFWAVISPELSHLRTTPSPRLEVQQIDTSKLDAIRKQWSKEREKALLLSKNQTQSSDAPTDAKYVSDRNIRVEKEQRARQTQVLPQNARPEQRPGERSAPQQKPGLSKLGVPLMRRVQAPGTGAQEYRPATPGGDQAILDPSLPEGGENMLNAQESIYYSFYARIYEAVAPVWQSHIRRVRPSVPLHPNDYQTFAEVVIDQDGNLSSVILHRSSGVPEFDRAVEEAWRKISRFPNPPRGLLAPDGKIHMGWNFTVQVGPGGAQFQFLPPERTQ